MRYLVKTNVDSSFIQAAIYNAYQRDLIVTMNTGKKYVYKNVPEHIAVGLAAAESAGTFFNQRIKNMFPFEKTGY